MTTDPTPTPATGGIVTPDSPSSPWIGPVDPPEGFVPAPAVDEPADGTTHEPPSITIVREVRQALRAVTGETPPLRDLAGMLRSFDYAAASSTHPEAGSWARRAGDAYLGGYEDAGGVIGDHALLTAFELDKAVYEASYEARNRPSWLPIPVHAIERLTSRSLA